MELVRQRNKPYVMIIKQFALEITSMVVIECRVQRITNRTCALLTCNILPDPFIIQTNDLLRITHLYVPLPIIRVQSLEYCKVVNNSIETR